MERGFETGKSASFRSCVRACERGEAACGREGRSGICSWGLRNEDSLLRLLLFSSCAPFVTGRRILKTSLFLSKSHRFPDPASRYTGPAPAFRSSGPDPASRSEFDVSSMWAVCDFDVWSM